MATTRQKQTVYEFGDFRLDAAKRQLLHDGQPVQLSSKAFDLLLVLVESEGRLVEKQELYQRVWADQIVEESNLTVHISAIRKALGERKQSPRYIVTVPGHGYRFIGNVANLGEEREVVIETETVSRIVVESEEISDAENDGAGQLLVVNGQSKSSAADGVEISSSRAAVLTVEALPAADAKRLMVDFPAQHLTSESTGAPNGASLRASENQEADDQWQNP
jgi:DNA-binding winged helix-turn-helix (wHTH) protein